MSSSDAPVRLDLNNPVLQGHLFDLQKPERHAAMDTLRKIRQLSWGQLYRDNGLKWEKIISVKPPSGIEAIYSLRITQSRRCTAYRDGDLMRLLTVAPDHDSTYGRKEANSRVTAIFRSAREELAQCADGGGAQTFITPLPMVAVNLANNAFSAGSMTAIATWRQFRS